MACAVVFPGQGAQKKGMGGQVFDRYPHLVAAADRILGYSLRELCLQDPYRRLSDTRYTQPALYAVSALTYQARLDDGLPVPDVVAGHSLGEYNALTAAGALDFETALRLVVRRGALMAQAPAGGMAAVVGLHPDRIRNILEEASLHGIDVANYNTPEQTTVAGLRIDLEAAEPVFKAAGARFIMLNVSAAFHSRYMAQAAAAFRSDLAAAPITSPRMPVLSNVTARPYPAEPERIRALLAEQIDHSVRWYATVSALLSVPGLEIQEVGPGNVLTKMIPAIAADPLPVTDPPIPTAAPRAARTAGPTEAQRPAAPPYETLPPEARVFMYTGQGSQYLGMGRELYEAQPVFRARMDACDAVVTRLTGQSLVRHLYQATDPFSPFDQLLLSNPANIAVGLALTDTLAECGLRPDAVLGYGIGEWTAACVAGVLSAEDALTLAVSQARLLQEHTPPGGMLAVFETPDLFARSPELFVGCTLAGRNTPRHFLISAPLRALDDTFERIRQRGIPCQRLPLHRALHHAEVDRIADAFLAQAAAVSFGAPRLPVYSPTLGGRCLQPDAAALHRACRAPVDFAAAVTALGAGGAWFIEPGPSGTLAGFAARGCHDKNRCHAVINRFGHNLESLDALLTALGSGMPVAP